MGKVLACLSSSAPDKTGGVGKGLQGKFKENILIIFLYKNLFCDPSLEPSH